MNEEKFKKIGKYALIIPEDFAWPRKPYVVLDVSGSSIIIEEKVTFASGVYVWTHDHPYYKPNWLDLPPIKNPEPTVFKHHSFIGVNSIILSKCKIIGEYSVIGAGSVVTKNVPAFQIHAGNPAKKIGEVERYG